MFQPRDSERVVGDLQRSRGVLREDVYRSHFVAFLHARACIISACGSRYETFETSGVSHFLEHLNFKGTPSRSKLDIEKGTEDFGGNLNAYTTRDMTCFDISVLDSKVREVAATDQGVTLVADIVTNSKYEQKAVTRERGTILAEVLSVHSDRWNTIAETSHFLAFRNNVLGLPILGLVENLDKISSETVKQYHRSNYHGSNLKVVAVGGVDHREIHQVCEEAFKNLRPTPPDRRGYAPPPAVFTPGYMWIRQPELEDRVHAIINFEAPGYRNPDYIGFLLLNNLLGESDSSAGFLASLPRKTGFEAVGDSINLLSNYAKYKCCFLPYTDTGLFTLYLDCDVADAHHAENLLVAFVNDLLFSVPAPHAAHRGEDPARLPQERQHDPRTGLLDGSRPGDRRAAHLHGQALPHQGLDRPHGRLRGQRAAHLRHQKVPLQEGRQGSASGTPSRSGAASTTSSKPTNTGLRCCSTRRAAPTAAWPGRASRASSSCGNDLTSN